MDELCISKRANLWLWSAVSRYSGQIIAYQIGDRSQQTLARLWAKVPPPYRRRLVYTDGYPVYACFFPAWQHRICVKGDGGTCTVEGVNTSWRSRCACLVRRTCSRSRSSIWMQRRLKLCCHAHNKAATKRWNRRFNATHSRQ